MTNNIAKNNAPQAGQNTELVALTQLWKTIKHQWLILVIWIVLGLAAAVTLWLTLSPKWQATAVLQIGQMPLSMPSKETAQSVLVLVEPPAQAVERLNQRELKDKALTILGLPLEDGADKGVALFRKSLKGIVVRNTNFIEINVAAYSIEDGKKYVNAIAQSLIAIHNQRMEPVLKNVDAEIKENTVQLEEVQAQRAKLQRTITSMPKSNDHFAQNIIAADLLAKQDKQIQELKREHFTIADILLPSNTYRTSIIDATFVPDSPYFPKLSLFLPIGLLLGAAIGCAIALLREGRQKKVI